MQTKYFTFDGKRWTFLDDQNKYEGWLITVDEKGITIDRYSEDYGGSFYNEHLTEILIEAVAIYKGYRNDTRVQVE